MKKGQSPCVVYYRVALIGGAAPFQHGVGKVMAGTSTTQQQRGRHSLVFTQLMYTST